MLSKKMPTPILLAVFTLLASDRQWAAMLPGRTLEGQPAAIASSRVWPLCLMRPPPAQ